MSPNEYIAARYADVEAQYVDISGFCKRHNVNEEEFRRRLYRSELAAQWYLRDNGVTEDFPRKAEESPAAPEPEQALDTPPEPPQAAKEPQEPAASPSPWDAVLDTINADRPHTWGR